MERGQRRNRVPECDLTAEDYVAESAAEPPQVTENWHLRNIIGSATYYRLSQILARSGLDLHHSTLADWVGKASFHLRPVLECLMGELRNRTSYSWTRRRFGCWTLAVA